MAAFCGRGSDYSEISPDQHVQAVGEHVQLRYSNNESLCLYLLRGLIQAVRLQQVDVVFPSDQQPAFILV